jgi:hypothetical protein
MDAQRNTPAPRGDKIYLPELIGKRWCGLMDFVAA